MNKLRPRTLRRSVRHTAVTVAAGTVIATGIVAGPGTGSPEAASHVDAPTVAADAAVDGTDFYAFTSPDNPDTVTFVANYHPIIPPGNPTGFEPFATRTHYDINVDGSGDGKPETTYRWDFWDEDLRPLSVGGAAFGIVTSLDSPNLKFRQHYSLKRISGGREEVLVRDHVAAPPHAGLVQMPDYGALRTQATTALKGGGKTMAGQSADSFVFNVGVFALLKAGAPVLPPVNPTVLTNVNSIALQVPKSEVALGGDVNRNPVIGAWATASRHSLDLSEDLRKGAGSYRQVGRMGNPFFGESLFQDGLPTGTRGGQADRFNWATPDTDHKSAGLMKAVQDPDTPRSVHLLDSRIPVPAAPRKDIEELFLTGIPGLNAHSMNKDASGLVPAEELRLNLTTPVSTKTSPWGPLGGDPQGWPNGRRPADDIVPVIFRRLMGEPGAKGAPQLVPQVTIGSSKPFLGTFPYLATPHALA
ncbi:DUF4331 domain-containing protein [Streptomyces sp. NBC_01465]|uniref:DUF4331 domain-containing protein n=1 Tax=Streptomyces sp. NBC_01465 TaxID=2903878 RepID=UPI002E36714C|nr:DUF4331 domain-containing protein [Streptomyces sp. NBC_01465]